MKALVTGGTGFIGSHLVETLCREGHQVRCLAKDSLNAASLPQSGVESILGDLNNGVDMESMLRDVDIVFHVAGLTRARVKSDYFEANCEATKRLLEACAKHGRPLKRFVHVSSLAAVGPRRTEEEVTETSDCRPISTYGKSKLQGEREVLKYRAAFPVAIVRPSAVYGPRDRDILEYFKLIRFGIEPVIGLGRKYMNIVHVEDLVKGILLAGTHPAAANEIFFLGSEEKITMREFCGEIARSEDVRTRKVVIPDPLLYAIGALSGAWGKVTRTKTLFNIQKAREATQKAWTCSVDKAVSRLGYHPAIPLREGLAGTYDWYRANGWL